MQHTVYILLTRSSTWFSRLIHLATEDDFTHASIGLEGPSGPFYSFARKYPNLAFPGGLVEERADGGFFALHPNTPCCLYELQVSEKTYQFLARRLRAMYAEKDIYHYSLLGVLASYFHLTFVRRHHYFCSEFVAKMLSESGALCLPQPPALTRPADFSRLERVRPIYRGRVGELAA